MIVNPSLKELLPKMLEIIEILLKVNQNSGYVRNTLQF